MAEERKYIYSIIRNPQEMSAYDKSASSAEAATEAESADKQASDTSRLSGGLFGINNRSITFIPYGDIAAAVSTVHFINFDTFDKKELAQFIAAHDQVNVSLMKKYDSIPMRFGMIAESVEEVHALLAKAYIQFKAALEKISGKAEFIVQTFWNEKNILEKIVHENIEIQKLKKEVELKGAILGFPSKIKLGKRIFDALESYRKEYTEDILSNLAIHFPYFSAGKLFDASKEAVVNETNPAQQQVVYGAGKKMIMNYSFLIGATEESALEFRLNQLAEKYQDEIKFKYIGPMAPYSFAVINLSLGNFELVDSARKIFGFGESVAFSEIKRAYYKLAGQYHPDKQSFIKDKAVADETEKKMKDIITANGVLTVYCNHYLSALSPEKEQICSFRKEDVEDSIIINEK